MRILVADDDRQMAAALADFLRDSNHEIVGVVHTGGIDVMHAFNRCKPDVLLMDYLMPKLNGLTACRNIRSRHPKAQIILFSGKAGADMPMPRDCGAVAILQKPFSLAGMAELLDGLELDESADHSDQFEAIAV